MIVEVKYADEFKKAFKQLKKKYRSLPDDFKALFTDLMQNPEQGDALTQEMRKVRMAITSKGKGKSGGARVIIRYRVIHQELSFLYIYDKSEMSNVADNFLKDIILKIDQ